MVTLSKEIIDLALQLRRHVRHEFGCDIRLREPDLIERLLHYAGLSQNSEFTALAARLRQLLPTSSPDLEPAPEVHYYRGVAVVHEHHDVDEDLPHTHAGVVYRGRRLG